MFATVDPVFRGRGPRNQYIPPITEENLQDNSYANMKRGGKVVKKKGKATATATATQVVNVYTGRRGRRRGPVQPRPAPQIITIRDSVQNPYLQGFAPVRREEPFGPSRMRDNSGSSSDIRMEQIDTSRFLPFGITQGRTAPLQMLNRETVPVRQQDLFDFDFSNFPVSQKQIPVPVRQQLPSEFVSQGRNPVDPFRLLPFNAEPYDQKILKQQVEPLANKYLLDYPHIQYSNLQGFAPVRREEPPPIKEQDGYEPFEPIEMKHEKEPDELILMEQDLQPFEPFQLYTPPYYGSSPPSPRGEEKETEEKAAVAAGGEPVEPARRRVRRTKEEIELAKQLQQAEKEEKQRRREQIKKLQQEQKEDAQAERLDRQIQAVRQQISDLRKEDENHPFLPQLRKRLDTLTKK
jgi:hypothetical protein